MREATATAQEAPASIAYDGERILRAKDVAKKIGMSRTWLQAEVKAGRFPAGVEISDRAVGWIASEVDNWILTRRRRRQITAAGDAQ